MITLTDSAVVLICTLMDEKDKAEASTSGVEVIDWAQEERDKLRQVAQGAWEDISKQSPLAKEAYDAYISFMTKMGML